MMDDNSILMTPILQYGFAGMCAVLLVIIVWLIWNLMKLLEKTNQIISANTQAICQVDQHSVEALKLLRETREKIIARPCIAQKERDG
ncbi:MAG: hypothetical protein PHF37_00465 [Phycisphaerae bacterium]|nr:hypothetical protein [Phycisphaerae bacterium]